MTKCIQVILGSQAKNVTLHLLNGEIIVIWVDDYNKKINPINSSCYYTKVKKDQCRDLILVLTKTGGLGF